MKAACPQHRLDLAVLALIGAGLITIVLSIVIGLFLEDDGAKLPNWAENVLVAIATGAMLKLGDTLSALVALATGRQVETLGQQLADSQPLRRVASDAAEGAQQAAVAARSAAEDLAADAPPQRVQAPRHSRP